MRTGIIIAVLVVSLLAVAACSQGQTSVVCPDGSTAHSLADCAPPTQQQPTPTPAQTPSQPVAQQQVAPQMPAALQALIDLHNTKVQSYQFIYAPILLLNSGPTVSLRSTYSVRGTKVRVDVWHPMSAPIIAASNIDTVYLDTATKEAHGFCMSNDPTKCSIQGDPRPATYDNYSIKLPLDWLADIPADATINNGVTFQNKNTEQVRYAEDGQYYELLIDSYSGIPLRVHIASDADYATIVGGAEYQQLTINYVKDADVTPPSNS